MIVNKRIRKPIASSMLQAQYSMPLQENILQEEAYITAYKTASMKGG
ncbi:hypothetical protein ACFSMW_13135 [Virgibacillus halophilus]